MSGEHVHVAESVGENMEVCACGAKRLNDTWRIPDEARTWSDPPQQPTEAGTEVLQTPV